MEMALYVSSRSVQYAHNSSEGWCKRKLCVESIHTTKQSKAPALLGAEHLAPRQPTNDGPCADWMEQAPICYLCDFAGLSRDNRIFVARI